MRNKIAILLTFCLLVLIAGCCITPPPPPPESQTGNANGCDKACFIAAANECQDMSVTLVEDAGTFDYSSSSNCTLTKTLVKLNDNETQDMKDLLQGKSMACPYEKGNFDSRLVGSLLYGIENCNGVLKDDIGRLVVFTETNP